MVKNTSRFHRRNVQSFTIKHTYIFSNSCLEKLFPTEYNDMHTAKDMEWMENNTSRETRAQQNT